MTTEDIIKTLKRSCAGQMCPQSVGYCEEQCEIGKAMKAVKELDNKAYKEGYEQGKFDEKARRIPRKPAHTAFGTECSVCGSLIRIRTCARFDFCPYCSQAIDWSEE